MIPFSSGNVAWNQIGMEFKITSSQPLANTTFIELSYGDFTPIEVQNIAKFTELPNDPLDHSTVLGTLSQQAFMIHRNCNITRLTGFFTFNVATSTLPAEIIVRNIHFIVFQSDDITPNIFNAILGTDTAIGLNANGSTALSAPLNIPVVAGKRLIIVAYIAGQLNGSFSGTSTLTIQQGRFSGALALVPT
jgi:hypothetical protein